MRWTRALALTLRERLRIKHRVADLSADEQRLAAALAEIDRQRAVIEIIDREVAGIGIPRTPFESDALTSEGQRLVAIRTALRDFFDAEPTDER